MALANYTDLVASVSNWMHRADLNSIIPDFIKLAETRISTDLTIQALEKEYTVTTVAGQKDYALPSDIISFVRLFIDDGSGNITIIQGYDPSTYRFNNANQTPKYYYVEIGELKLLPVPDTVYSVTLIYKGEVPSLQDNTTNSIMTKYPNIYLWATLLESALYIEDEQKASTYEARYKQAIKDANNAEDFRDHELLSTEVYASLPRRSYDIRVM